MKRIHWIDQQSFIMVLKIHNSLEFVDLKEFWFFKKNRKPERSLF